MTEQDIIAAIDVGTTKVLALLAAIDGPGRPRILAHSVVPCEGLERGNVTDVAKTTEAVRAALNRVEAETGLEVRAAHVGVSGSHVDYENRRDSVRGVGSVGVITKEELSADLPNRASALEDHRELLHAVPLSYTVDGEEGIRNPVGMHSATVEVDTHLISADRSRLDRLTRAVREAGVEVDELIMEPLASGMAVLTAEDMQYGTMMIDIGGGTSDVVVFAGGQPSYTGVVPVGGYQFTNDICVTYNVEYEAAERAKRIYGHAHPASADPTKMISLPLRDRPAQVTVSSRELSQLLRERAVELAKMVRIKLEEAEEAHIESSRAVLTGGASELPGISEIFQRYLGRAVRLGRPIDFAIEDEVADPSHATGVGMLVWASNQAVHGSLKHVRSRPLAVPPNGSGSGPWILRWLYGGSKNGAQPAGEPSVQQV